MAKVLIHSAALEFTRACKWDTIAYELFLESAHSCRFSVHSLTSDPAAADLIIFTEGGHASGAFAEMVRHHPLVRRYREKCFMWDCNDYALPFLPGVYASLGKKHHHPARTRSGYYLTIDANPFIDFRPFDQSVKYLGTFIGSKTTHPVRLKLAELPSDDFLIELTSGMGHKFVHRGGTEQERHEFWSHYADGMAAGAFSLCPRGIGRSSVRLFESMCMGRCPVILADDWVPPARVKWDDCSLRVPQKHVHALPELLRANLGRAEELGLQARQEWEKYYAPDVRFHWLVEDCLEMLQARRVPESKASRLVWLHLLEGTNWRIFLNSKKQIYKSHGKFLL